MVLNSIFIPAMFIVGCSTANQVAVKCVNNKSLYLIVSFIHSYLAFFLCTQVCIKEYSMHYVCTCTLYVRVDTPYKKHLCWSRETVFFFAVINAIWTIYLNLNRRMNLLDLPSTSNSLKESWYIWASGL